MNKYKKITIFHEASDSKSNLHMPEIWASGRQKESPDIPIDPRSGGRLFYLFEENIPRNSCKPGSLSLKVSLSLFRHSFSA